MFEDAMCAFEMFSLNCVADVVSIVVSAIGVSSAVLVLFVLRPFYMVAVVMQCLRHHYFYILK